MGEYVKEYERLADRRRFHELCDRRGWPTSCNTCGNGLEDPHNTRFDAFCDFCCAYYNFGPHVRAEDGSQP